MEHQVIHLVVANGDEAVVLNGAIIYAVGPDNEGLPAYDLAKNIANSVGVAVQRHEVDTPKDPLWDFDSVLKNIPPRSMASSSKVQFGTNHTVEINTANEHVKISTDSNEGDLDISMDCEIKLGQQYGADKGTVKIPLIEINFDEDNPGIVIQRVSDRLEIWTNEAYRADKLATLGFNPDGSLYMETPRPPILDAF